MLINLLNTSNYISFNIDLANILGLTASIYISELININEKAIRKNKVCNDFFTVDRNYIKNRTTISIEDQRYEDKKLVQIGVLNISPTNPDSVSIDFSVLTTLVMTKDESLIADVSNIAKKKRNSADSKVNAIKKEMKTYIKTDNSELRDAYSDWIDAVVAKQGWMSKKSVEVGQNTVDSYSGRNLDIALNLLSIAALNGYRDIQWAINVYESNNCKSLPDYKKINSSNKSFISNPKVGDVIF